MIKSLTDEMFVSRVSSMCRIILTYFDIILDKEKICV